MRRRLNVPSQPLDVWMTVNYIAAFEDCCKQAWLLKKSLSSKTD